MLIVLKPLCQFFFPCFFYTCIDRELYEAEKVLIQESERGCVTDSLCVRHDLAHSLHECIFAKPAPEKQTCAPSPNAIAALL